MADHIDLRRWPTVKPVRTGDGSTTTVQLPQIPGIYKGSFLLFPGAPDGIRYQVVEVISREIETGPLVRVAYAPRTMAEIQVVPLRRQA